MIIDYLNIKCIPSAPTETDSPLIVDADAMLPTSLSLESFEAVPRRRSEIAKFRGAVQLAQFSTGHLLEHDKTRDTFSVVQPFGVAAAKGADHPLRV